MKTRLAILILVIGLLLAIQVSPVDARSYYSERFDVQIDIQDNGSLIVTETVVFYFEGGPYTYAFRDLALRELDRVEILEASMDGQVPESLTYQQWLRQQPQAIQNDVLGKGRAAMFRAGTPLTDMRDRQGNVLTLTELRALDK